MHWLFLSKPIPSHLRTLIAVPTLLATLEAIEEQIERLEMHHLASPEGDLHFCAGFRGPTAAYEKRTASRCTSSQRRKALASRSALWPGAGRRPLSASASPWGLRQGEARWIGWERKRGELHELNQLLVARPTRLSSTSARSAVAPTDIATS